MSNEPAICAYCRHLGAKGPNGLACAAYPAGIPRGILDFDADHRRPLPGDRGIQFEAREDAAPDMVAWAFRLLDEPRGRPRSQPNPNATRSGANVR